MRRSVFPAALVIVLLCGCGHRPGAVDPPPAAPQIRVMSYNVNCGGPRMASTIAAIRDSRADIVALQEITEPWERAIRKDLSAQYPHMIFRRHLFPAGGLAVLSRWPISQWACVQPLGGWFPALIVEGQTPLGEIQLAVVHLHPPVGSKEGSRHVRNVRRDEIKSLLTHVRANQPTVILGDFNEDHDGLAVQHLITIGYRSAFSATQEKSPTWRVHIGEISAEECPDHILFSPDLTCIGATIIDGGGSDHLPICAWFRGTGPICRNRPRSRAAHKSDLSPSTVD